MRLPSTATIVDHRRDGAAWLLRSSLGADDRAAMILGFIPARFSGRIELSPAVPAFLTPLTRPWSTPGRFTSRSTC